MPPRRRVAVAAPFVAGVWAGLFCFFFIMDAGPETHHEHHYRSHFVGNPPDDEVWGGLDVDGLLQRAEAVRGKLAAQLRGVEDSAANSSAAAAAAAATATSPPSAQRVLRRFDFSGEVMRAKAPRATATPKAVAAPRATATPTAVGTEGGAEEAARDGDGDDGDDGDAGAAAGAVAFEAPGECVDSTSWYYDKKKKGCAYIEAQKSKKCWKKSGDGVRASEACPAACGQCCEDSATWFYDKEGKGKDCAYVARVGRKKCSERGVDGRTAFEACPVTCEACGGRAVVRSCGEPLGLRGCAKGRHARAAPKAPKAPKMGSAAAQRRAVAGLAAWVDGGLGGRGGFQAVDRALYELAVNLGNSTLEAVARQRGLCKRARIRATRPEKCGRQRWFFVPDTRKDMAFVKEILFAMGMCGYTKKKAPPDATVDAVVGHAWPTGMASSRGFAKEGWNNSWARPFSPALAPGAAVGGGLLPGLNFLGAKQYISHLYNNCAKDADADAPRAALCPEHKGDGLLIGFDVDGDEVDWISWQRAGGVGKLVLPPEPVIEPRMVERFDVLRAEIVEALQERRGLEASTWIIKPQSRRAGGQHMSRGMHLASMDHAVDLADDNAFLRWIGANMKPEACDGDVTKKYREETQVSVKFCARMKVCFQHFVDDVSTVFGRKYDVRVWTLVTSVDPLRVYVMRHGFPKISSKTLDDPATGRRRNISDLCAHIKLLMNPACNVTSYHEFTDGMQPEGYPKTTASYAFHRRLRLADAAYPGAKGPPEDPDALRAAHEDVFSSVTWPRVEELLTKILLRERRHLVAAAAAQAAAEGAFVDDADHFGFISPDFVVDARGAPHLEEINAKGLIVGQHDHDGGAAFAFTDYGYVRDMFRAAGVDGYPDRAAYEAPLAAAVCAFCDGREADCGPDEVRAMRRAVHEEAHAGPNWYRLYPPLPCLKTDGTCATAKARWPDEGASAAPLAAVFPDQFVLTDAHIAAFGETKLDRVVREFLEVTDTAKIHGRAAVPGHARWAPRPFVHPPEDS